MAAVGDVEGTLLPCHRQSIWLRVVFMLASPASAISSPRPCVLLDAVLECELTGKHGAHEHDEPPPCTARNSSTRRRVGMESRDAED